MKPDEVHNNFCHDGEHGDLDLLHQAWLQKCQEEKEDNEILFSSPELGI